MRPLGLPWEFSKVVQLPVLEWFYAVSKYDSSQSILQTEHIRIVGPTIWSSYLVEQKLNMILREFVCENELESKVLTFQQLFRDRCY